MNKNFILCVTILFSSLAFGELVEMADIQLEECVGQKLGERSDNPAVFDTLDVGQFSSGPVALQSNENPSVGISIELSFRVTIDRLTYIDTDGLSGAP
jgi:hypothetical protein